jgi:hypothetical protein
MDTSASSSADYSLYLVVATRGGSVDKKSAREWLGAEFATLIQTGVGSVLTP